MKKVESLRQLQIIQVYVYNDLLSVCKKHGLNLYLIGGTLLGAVRHKGFIPWDDDVDVCMSRPDFNKLMEITNGKISEKCRIINPEQDKDFKGYIPLAVFENSNLISKQFRGEEQLKIGISIFIYDGVPKNKIIRYFYFKKMYLLRAKHALCRANFKNVNTRAAKIFGPILSPFFKEKHVYKYKEKILKNQKKYKYENSAYVCTNADKDAHREVMERDRFEIPLELKFEMIKSWTFSDYKKYLTSYYGDYLKLPPIEEQKGKHSFEAEIEDDFVFKENGINLEIND